MNKLWIYHVHCTYAPKQALFLDSNHPFNPLSVWLIVLFDEEAKDKCAQLNISEIKYIFSGVMTLRHNEIDKLVTQKWSDYDLPCYQKMNFWWWHALFYYSDNNDKIYTFTQYLRRSLWLKEQWSLLLSIILAQSFWLWFPLFWGWRGWCCSGRRGRRGRPILL